MKKIVSLFQNRIILPFRVLKENFSHGEIALGILTALATMFNGIKLFKGIYKKKHKLVLKKLNKEFGYITDKYRDYEDNCQYDEKSPIWVSWMQGYDDAPELVQKCINSIKSSTEHPVYLIEKENLEKYTDFPSYIMEKYERKLITNAQFSDILRMNLLSRHGGLWIDATVFVPNSIPENIFEEKFYTCKRAVKETSYVSGYRWTSFINGCQKGCVIQKCMNELFLAYWEKKNYLIDYLLVDYFMCMVYDNIPQAKDLIDELPFNNSKVDDFQNVMNDTYKKDKYNEIIGAKDTFFYKLSWRMKFKKTSSDGKKTFFGHFTDS